MTRAERQELGLLRQLESKLRDAVTATQKREEKWPEYLKTKGVKFWADALARMDEYRNTGFKHQINGSGTPTGENLQERSRKASALERTGADTGTAGRWAERPAASTNFKGQADEPHDRQHLLRRSKMAKLVITPEIEAHTNKAVAAAIKAERKRVADGIKALELPEGTTARAGAAIKKAVKEAVAAQD